MCSCLEIIISIQVKYLSSYSESVVNCTCTSVLEYIYKLANIAITPCVVFKVLQTIYVKIRGGWSRTRAREPTTIQYQQ